MLAHPVPAGLRDLLPPEAFRSAELCRRLVRSFELHGYELVTVPLFEFADVVERGLGSLEPHEVLKFVEPESGAVVSLRPDMTPQIARLVATRLSGEPGPVRLCYQGSVLRRRRERARRHRQIPQAGVELIGAAGAAGDLELLGVVAAAVRVAGLEEFVLDLGHAGVAGALVEGLAPEDARGILEALEMKDESEVLKRAERSGLAAADRAALAALPALHGGGEIWSAAERALGGTRAEAALLELKRLWESACAAELAPSVLVDLGETRDLDYYTGALFHIHAEGPGRPIGSGGRYDGLLGRFGAPRPAVGFAFGLDDLAWALERAGKTVPLPARLLLTGEGEFSDVERALRAADLATARAPSGDPRQYARAWRYSHLIELGAGAPRLVSVADGQGYPLPSEPTALALEVKRLLER
ncbi:MAG: ATP phosphoribosyltransferase regulatory subunit [Pseudomonadota bacterium]